MASQSRVERAGCLYTRYIARGAQHVLDNVIIDIFPWCSMCVCKCARVLGGYTRINTSLGNGRERQAAGRSLEQSGQDGGVDGVGRKLTIPRAAGFKQTQWKLSIGFGNSSRGSAGPTISYHDDVFAIVVATRLLKAWLVLRQPVNHAQALPERHDHHLLVHQFDLESTKKASWNQGSGSHSTTVGQ